MESGSRREGKRSSRVLVRQGRDVTMPRAANGSLRSKASRKLATVHWARASRPSIRYEAQEALPDAVGSAAS